MYFWTLNSNIFPEFLYHPHLLLQVKGLESSTPGLKCVFTVGAMKNSRISTPREMVSFFCNDVCSVMEVLGHEYNPDQWHLFIDSSKVSLMLVLFHNVNKFPSVPLVHAANM